MPSPIPWAIGKQPQHRPKLSTKPFGVVMSHGPMKWFDSPGEALRFIHSHPAPKAREQFKASLEATR